MHDAIARLRLIRTPQVGPVTYRQLLQRFGSAGAAIEALPERELAAAAKPGARHLFLGDPDYPSLLAELDNAPRALMLRGDVGLMRRMVVAMVGARNALAAAVRFARQLAVELGREDVTVVSGLARAVDTAAHVGIIASGTIAVIASGIDIVFPPENAELQERIAAEGPLIAEQPPRARHFLYRNQIIAGLGLGTVVVEAAPKSGSLITARLAAELGREVMAVPGSPLDPRTQGCNMLIREGATLAQGAADILEQIRPIDARMVRAPGASFGGPPPQDASDTERNAVITLLGPVPVATDELIRQSGLAPGTVQTILLELELAGRLERHAGGRVSLT